MSRASGPPGSGRPPGIVVLTSRRLRTRSHRGSHRLDRYRFETACGGSRAPLLQLSEAVMNSCRPSGSRSGCGRWACGRSGDVRAIMDMRALTAVGPRVDEDAIGLVPGPARQSANVPLPKDRDLECRRCDRPDFTQVLPRKLLPTRAEEAQRQRREKRGLPSLFLWLFGAGVDLKRAHNPKVAGSNPAPATSNG